MKTKFYRNCPSCNKKIEYSRKDFYERAIRQNRKCNDKKCKYSLDVKRKMSLHRRGIPMSDEQRENLKIINKGKGNPNFRGYGKIPLTFFNKFKYGAEGRNIKFDITIEDLEELRIKQNNKCSYTGEELIFSTNSTNIASLDRKDSSKGYTINNIQLIQKHINIMKQSYTEDYFIKMCKKISDYQSHKNIN